MKRFLLCTQAVLVLLPLFSASPPGDTPAAAQKARAPTVLQKNYLIPGWLWSGSWESEKNLSNRAQLTLDMPEHGLGFRVQLTDRRKAGSWDTFTESFSGPEGAFPLTALSGGVYHTVTDSRLLYGMVSSYGLASRVRSPWIRGSPFVENHTASSADLKTETSSTALPSWYLYLGSPILELSKNVDIKAYGAFSMESEGERGNTFSFSGGKPGFTAGSDVIFSKNGLVRLETYYTEGTIPARNASAWFSDKPSLPGRNFALHAGSLAFTIPGFGFALDGAYSETFAYGKGFYGNAAVRFGDRPWRLSLAADGAGSRYVGPDGGENTAGFRFAAKLERRGKRGSLLKFDALIRSAETKYNVPEDYWDLAGQPNRGSLGFYYRLPSGKAPFGLSRVSFKLSGDGRDEKKKTGGAEFLAGVTLWQFTSETQLKLSGVEDAAGSRYDSFRLHEGVIWNRDFLQCRAGLGCQAVSGKETVWDFSLSAALRVKQGWFKVKLDSAQVPKDWSWTLSWVLKR